jgi:hypothetical protein
MQVAFAFSAATYHAILVEAYYGDRWIHIVFKVIAMMLENSHYIYTI